MLVIVLCASCGSSVPPAPTATPGETATLPPPAPPTDVPTATPTPLAPPDQQVLRIQCCYTDPRSLRPQAAAIPDELSIISGIQRGLLYRDAQGGLVPSLAIALPDVSADGLTYTYTLRDAQYSDGTPIVAADIVRAARALADPRNAFELGHLMCYVEGVTEVLGADFGCPDADTPYSDPEAGLFDDAQVDGLLDQIGVTAPDEHTVVFQLDQPASFWPDITAMWLLTPVPQSQTSWAEAGDIVSSGPFMIDTWTHNQHMGLVPNPNWYGLAPTLQRIDMYMTGDPSADLAAWERGDRDLVRVPTTDLARVSSTPEYVPLINRSGTLWVEYWNFATCHVEDTPAHFPCPTNDAVTKGVVGGSPTQNLHFRQALTQAIDKTDLINQAMDGIGVAAYSPTMPGIPGFPTVTADNNPSPFDPAAAIEIMATALGELGVAEPDESDIAEATEECDADCQHTRAWIKVLGPLKFGYNCDSGHDEKVKYLAEHWRQVLGFSNGQLDIRCTDFAGFPGSFRGYRGDFYDISRNGWSADFPHPDNQNRNVFTCNLPYRFYCNPAYDELLDQGAAAASYEQSLQFYHQAEQLLVEDAPVFFMRYGETNSVIRPWVINYVQTPSDHMNVGDTLYETIQIAAH